MINQVSKETIVFLVLAVLAVGYVVMDAGKVTLNNNVAGQAFNFKIDDTSLVKKYTPQKNINRPKTSNNLVTYCPSYATKDYSKKYGMKTSLACNYALSTSYLSKKNLNSFYSCFLDPLPLDFEKSACPSGSELNEMKSTNGNYVCVSKAPFISSCLSGYKLVYDSSQKKEYPQADYEIVCDNGLYNNEKFPCGNSGALVIPTPSYEGYCCGFFEK